MDLNSTFKEFDKRGNDGVVIPIGASLSIAITETSWISCRPGAFSSATYATEMSNNQFLTT